MKTDELELFIKMLPDYFVHLKTYKYSLLARFYGVYTVKMEDVSSVSLVIMANTAQVQDKSGIRHSFDLKGSFINRKVEVNHKMKATTTLKDLNLLDLIKILSKTGRNSKMIYHRSEAYQKI
jgi:1-phosphatidylinositol-4-phosphate 5-kinase